MVLLHAHTCSGESGAGKTESAKLIVSQLMELSQSRSLLEQRILQVGNKYGSLRGGEGETNHESANGGELAWP